MRRVASLSFALILLLSAAPVLAQDDDGAPPLRHRRPQPAPIEERMALLSERLGLTEDQQNDVQLILEEQDQEMQALMEELGGPPSNPEDRVLMHGRLEEIRRNSEEQMAQILDEAQMEEFRAIGERHRRRGRRDHQQRPTDEF